MCNANCPANISISAPVVGEGVDVGDLLVTDQSRAIWTIELSTEVIYAQRSPSAALEAAAAFQGAEKEGRVGGSRPTFQTVIMSDCCDGGTCLVRMAWSHTVAVSGGFGQARAMQMFMCSACILSGTLKCTLLFPSLLADL